MERGVRDEVEARALVHEHDPLLGLCGTRPRAGDPEVTVDDEVDVELAELGPVLAHGVVAQRRPVTVPHVLQVVERSDLLYGISVEVHEHHPSAVLAEPFAQPPSRCRPRRR